MNAALWYSGLRLEKIRESDAEKWEFASWKW
jgi:hypothetical protein